MRGLGARLPGEGICALRCFAEAAISSMSGSWFAVSLVIRPEKPSICWFCEINWRSAGVRRTRRRGFVAISTTACFTAGIALISSIYSIWSTVSIAPGAPSPHRWNEIRRLPIHPEIRSLDDYEQAVSIGTGNAIAFLKEVNVLESLRIDDLRKV